MAAPGPNNPLLNPNVPLSGKALLQAAQGLASAQTSPVIAALAQQIAQNDQQTKGAVGQVGGFYHQLGQQAQGAAGQTGQAASGLNSQLQGIGADENAQLQGIGDNAMSMLSRYTPSATPGDTSQSSPALQALTSEIARQKGLAAQNEGAFRSFGATQGANYQGLANSLGGTFALGGQEALRNIASAGRLADLKPEAQLANEHQVYGADLATALGKLRQQEITNGISRAGLGLRLDQINAGIGNNVRTNQTSRANNRLTNQTSSANNRRTAAQSNLNNQRTTSTSAANNAATNATRIATHNLQTGSGGARPLTPQQNNSMLTQLGAIPGLIASGQKHGLSEAQIRANLSDGKNPSRKPFNPVLIQAAYELAGYGAVSPQTAAQLHAMGIRGGTFSGRPINVARSNPTVNKQVSGVNRAAGNAVNSIVSGI